MVGNSFIGKERELRIHEKREEFHISRERAMERGSRTRNGRSHSKLHLLETASLFSSFLVREVSPPFLENIPEDDQHNLPDKSSIESARHV